MQMTGIKPKDVIKLKEVPLLESYPPEDTLPEDGLYHYLLQPGEELDDQCKRAMDRIWSSKTHRLSEVTLSHSNQVMYHLKDGLKRVFMKEELMLIPEDTELLPLECYMDWFLSLICKNYIFKHFVKTVERTSLKFCTIIELITLHLEYTIAQVKYANFSYAHAQIFVLFNGEMTTVSTGFRKLKFWLWLLRTVFYLNQTSF